MKKREYLDYVQDMLDSIKEIEEFTSGMDYRKFNSDKKTINAVIRSLEIIGEAAKKIPKDIRNKTKKIPWKRISGMRDKLIHEYFGVDLEKVWFTVKKDIPPLKPLIQKVKKYLKQPF